MKIILKEDVRGLGYKDDVVEVKDGYGRNYLIPQGKAVVATPSALKVLAENQRQQAHKLAEIKAKAEEAAKVLEGVALTIGAKTSATGTIFGSVNAIQIAEALEKLGVLVKAKDSGTECAAFAKTLDFRKMCEEDSAVTETALQFLNSCL